MERGKIGIFLPGGNGDIMSAMSVLKYKDTLWPNKDVVWFCGNNGSVRTDGPAGRIISGSEYREVLKYNDAISEVRYWPHGWREPGNCESQNLVNMARGEPLWADFSVLKDSNNHLDLSRKHLFESTKDLEQGYFPAPWMVETAEQRNGVDYPNFSRKVFGADSSWVWHPYLCFLDEERKAAESFCLRLPYKKTVMLETVSSSFASPMDDDLIREIVSTCRAKLGECNFIFASFNDNSRFFDDIGMVSCSCFTMRQTALVNNYCDLFVGISSGISVATSCWGNKPVPKLQYCGNFRESTVSLANGPIELVVKQDWLTGASNPNHRQEFKSKLSGILGKI
jgi:hypothetical protein